MCIYKKKKTAKSQPCTIEKLDKDIQQKRKTLTFVLTTNRTPELNQTGKQKGKSQSCTT